MKTRPLHEVNLFVRKTMIFRYGSKEILLKELSAADFLTAIQGLFDKGTRFFTGFLNIPPVKTEFFEEFLKAFLMLHKDSLNDKKDGTTEGIAIKEAIEAGIKIVRIFALTFYMSPEEAGRAYSLRQMVLWLKDNESQCQQKTQKADAGKESKIPYLPVPSKAKNFREWIDGAGNRCRSYEVEI